MPETEQIINVLLLMMLGTAAIEDLKTGRISLIVPAGGALLCLSLKIVYGEFRLGDAALGAGIGVILILLGYASSHAVGYGDGIMLMATGCVLGGITNFILLLSSLLISAFYSMAVLALKRKKKVDRIPFIPFILGGFVLLTGVYGC